MLFHLDGEVMFGPFSEHKILLLILILAVHHAHAVDFLSSFMGAYVGIMTILAAMETHHSIIGPCDLVVL